jgi:hypothetical protein
MPTNVIVSKLGYSGSAVIAGKQVLITSGSFNKSINSSYIEPMSIPASMHSRSRVLHADGVISCTGQLSLDVTDNFLLVLTKTTLLGRYYNFDVGIHDGEKSQKMTGCYITSLSLSGSQGGLITASIGFISPNAAVDSTVSNLFIRGEEPLAYWESGNTNVRDWSFTMNQAATPVYGNKNTISPKYIKIGLVDYNLSVTTFDSIVSHKTINIKTSSFTLTGVSTSEDYSFAGVTDLGNYRHTFESAASAADGSGGVIIT